MSYKSKNLNITLLAFASLALISLSQMIARLIMMYLAYDSSNMANFTQDMPRMLMTGFLYDLRVAAIISGSALLISLPITAIKPASKLIHKTVICYLSICITIIITVSIANIFYFETFHQPFDIFMFGLFEDDTKSVLSNIWDDYPVIPLATLILVASIVSWRILNKLSYKKFNSISNTGFIVTILISVTILSLMGRGSVGTFPLRRGNAQVSENATLNHLTPNAIMALSWAWKDKKTDIQIKPVSHQEGQILLEKLGIESIHATTPYNQYLAENPPHVVVTLLESFGSNMLEFDHEQDNDMLGSLRQHFAQDYVFHRFLPHGNGTAPSLAALFFNSPIQSISHSSAANIKLETAFSTYKGAGYQVIFISPGNMMWRNLANYLPVQGVDRVIDQNTLMQHYPEARQHMTDWGLPDEYAYKYAGEILNDAQQPVFIGILSVTNHPPYRTPDTYKPRPVSQNTGYAQHAEAGKIDHDNLLTTFQYAANAYGDFVGAIKSSNLAEKTVLAATGDHQMRRIKAYYPQEAIIDRAVPFYLYIPESIKQHSSISYQPLRSGSHKDIMPTVIAHSLSDTTYLALAGRNMLAKEDEPNKNFGYNELAWLQNEQVVSLQKPWTKLEWQNPDNGLLVSNSEHTLTEQQSQHIQAYVELLRWNLARQVKGYGKDHN